MTYGGHVPISHDEQDRIRALLLGHNLVRVGDSTIMLDNGTQIEIEPNDGGCVCGAGDYVLERLADSVDAIITAVDFDYNPTDSYDGWYRVFVVAAEKRINLFSVVGGDGNGYYGTGFDLQVRTI